MTEKWNCLRRPVPFRYFTDFFPRSTWYFINCPSFCNSSSKKLVFAYSQKLSDHMLVCDFWSCEQQFYNLLRSLLTNSSLTLCAWVWSKEEIKQLQRFSSVFTCLWNRMIFNPSTRNASSTLYVTLLLHFSLKTQCALTFIEQINKQLNTQSSAHVCLKLNDFLSFDFNG